MIEISLKDARRLSLHRQGLLRSGHFGRGKSAVLRAVEHLGYVQIDTISVVDRAHHHVLKTRVPGYSEEMLDLLTRRDRKIFEYWSHAAAYLPLSEYRFYLPMMEGFEHTRNVDKKLATEILARIAGEGPLRSKDFERPGGGTSNGWWDWKPAKRALEHLFLSGRLMVAYREGFQKAYDLRENVLPPGVDTTMPAPDEWYRYLVLRVVRGFGIATANSISTACRTAGRFLRRTLRKEILTAIDQLVEDGNLVQLSCAGKTWYALPEAPVLLPLRLGRREIRFLSPFDHAVIDRRRTFGLFGFDYQVECYVPEAKRRYGYYCLPILWGDEFIGRLDARAVRNASRLEIRGLFLEPGIKADAHLNNTLAGGIRDLAEANQCSSVEMPATAPSVLMQTG